MDWENELNAMVADDHERTWEFNSMIMQEGIDYDVTGLESLNVEESLTGQDERFKSIENAIDTVDMIYANVSEIKNVLGSMPNSKEFLADVLLKSMLPRAKTSRKSKSKSEVFQERVDSESAKRWSKSIKRTINN